MVFDPGSTRGNVPGTGVAVTVGVTVSVPFPGAGVVQPAQRRRQTRPVKRRRGAFMGEYRMPYRKMEWFSVEVIQMGNLHQRSPGEEKRGSPHGGGFGL